MFRENTIRQLLRTGSGRAGSVFFVALVIISIYVVATYPLDFGVRSWSNLEVWADNPKSAPPVWSSLFSGFRRAEHQTFVLIQPTQPPVIGEVSRTNLYQVLTNFQADDFPTLMSFTLSQVRFYERSPLLTITFIRPDQRQLLLYSFAVPAATAGEEPPITRYYETPFRVGLSTERNAISAVADFARSSLGVDVTSAQIAQQGMLRVLFGTPGNGGFSVLKGQYVIQVAIELFDPRDTVGSVRLVLGGSAYGLLGTDSLGRDLAVGILFGFPVALFIGLVTSVLTTLLGALTGIVSGYVGGKTDTLIQRVSDILNNIPLLPILIFFAFLFGQKLWVVILVLIAFGWPGLTVIIRSMVLQIKSEQFVEAAKVAGASRMQIILRHIFPQTAPYVLAQMIFLAPAAILAEAALSFLGLGDPSIPTWGQILESGFRSGAVYVGFWWWILPPGLLIIFTAMTFVLISLGLEPVVNPRLRRLR